MATAQDFLRVALSQVGYKEGRNNDTKYGKWYGMNYQPYCAMGLSWCADQLGILGTIIPKYASSWHGREWFRQRGQTGVWPPEPGDLFVLAEWRRPENRDWTADKNGYCTIHTGAVRYFRPVDSVSGWVHTVEFNTNDNGSASGDGVYELVRFDRKSDLKITYMRPKWGSARPGRTEPSRPPILTKPPVAPTKPQISVENLRAKAGNVLSNNDVAQYNASVWYFLRANSPDYVKAHAAAWAKESSQTFGWETACATFEMYKALQRRDPKNVNWQTLPSHSPNDWATPGQKALEALGFQVI